MACHTAVSANSFRLLIIRWMGLWRWWNQDHHYTSHLQRIASKATQMVATAKQHKRLQQQTAQPRLRPLPPPRLHC